MAINTYAFSGNLVADPKKAGTAETPILDFTVAINCPKKVNGEWTDEPLYLDCVMFGNRAKSLGGILAKGMPVSCQGRLYPDNYEKDGKTVYKIRCNVAEIQLPAKGDKSDTAW